MDEQAECISCQGGTACPGGSTRTICTAGTAAAEGAASCHVCPSGSYSDRPLLAACKVAEFGHRASGGSDHTAAPKGSFVSEDKTGFVSCPDKRTTTGVGAGDSAVDCKPAPGYYGPDDGVSAVTVCPANSYCPLGSIGPTSCMPHGSSPEGSSSIDNCTCTSPRFKTPQNTCVGCPVGSYFQGESCGECTPCTPGFEIDRACGGTEGDDDQTCSRCPRGSFSTELNTETCDLCPAGTYQDALGKTKCKDCQRGYGCPTGSQRQTVCQPGYETRAEIRGEGCFGCAAGKYAPLRGTTFCRDAERGHFAPANSSTSTACSAGTYANKPIGADECVDADAGFYVPVQSQIAPTICPAGFQCPTPATVTPEPCLNGSAAQAGSAVCEACPEGSFGSYDQQVLCDVCPAGFECAGGTDKHICPLGEYAPEGSAVCLIAAPGFYVAAVGQESPLPCPFGHSCPGADALEPNAKGFYSNAARSAQVACGTLRTTEGEAKGWDITDCGAEPGYYGPLDGVTLPEGCPPDHYCEYGSESPVRCMNHSTSPELSESIANCTCDDGFFRTHDHQCTICPEGQFMGAEGVCIDCTSCPAGTFAQVVCEGATDATCKQCAPGSVTAVPDQPQCQTCNAGKYTLQPAQTACVTCEPGYGCAGGSNHVQCQPGESTDGIQLGAPACLPCAAGTRAPEIGSVFCSVCPAGTECPEGAVNYTICEPGTAARKRSRECGNCTGGSYGQTFMLDVCHVCEGGFECNGLTHREICARGYAAAEGSAVCTFCPPGYYSDRPGLSACKLCPRGYYCEGGAHRKPCRAGTASSAGAVECYVCPEDYYTQKEASPECLPCGEGYVCPGGSSRTPCLPSTDVELVVTATSTAAGRSGQPAEGRETFRGYAPRQDAERFSGAGNTGGNSSCPATGLGTGGKTDNGECMQGMVYDETNDECELPTPPDGFFVQVTPPKLSPFPDPETAPSAEPGTPVAEEAGFINFNAAPNADQSDEVGVSLNLTDASISRFSLRLKEQVIFTLEATDLEETLLLVYECDEIAGGNYNCSGDDRQLIKLSGLIASDQRIQSKSNAVDIVYVVPTPDGGSSQRRLLHTGRGLLQEGALNMAWQEYTPPKVVNSTCPKDFFSSIDETGTVACVGCPALTHTEYAAAPQESYCRCDDGLYASVKDFQATSAYHTLHERGHVDGYVEDARMWQSIGQITTSHDNIHAFFAEHDGSCVIRAYDRPAATLSTMAGVAGSCTFNADGLNPLTFSAPTGVDTHPTENNTFFAVDAKAGVIVRFRVDLTTMQEVQGSAQVVAGTGDGSGFTNITVGERPTECALRYPTGLRRVDNALFTAVVDSDYSQYHAAIVKLDLRTGVLSRKTRFLTSFDRPQDVSLFPYWFTWDVYGDEMFYQDFDYGRNKWVAYNYKTTATRVITPPFSDIPSIKQLNYLVPILPDVHLVTVHYRHGRPTPGSIMLYNETSGDRVMLTEPIFGLRQVFPTADKGEVLGVLYTYIQETGMVSIKLDRTQTCVPCAADANCSTGYENSVCTAPVAQDTHCIPGQSPAPRPSECCATVSVPVHVSVSVQVLDNSYQLFFQINEKFKRKSN